LVRQRIVRDTEQSIQKLKSRSKDSVIVRLGAGSIVLRWSALSARWSELATRRNLPRAASSTGLRSNCRRAARGGLMGAVDVASPEVTVEASPKRLSTMGIKTVVAGAVGEGLEIYDFLVFSFFAVYISRAFFPQQGPTQSLLLAVATLGLGFVTRPLGAFYLGMYADRFGRKKVLTLTIWLMGGATAAIAGETDYMCDSVGHSQQMVAAGQLNGLAITGAKRSAAAPDVPTMSEEGVNVEAYIWLGLLGPKGLPADVRDKLSTEMARIMNSANIKRRALNDGYDVAAETPEQFATEVNTEKRIWEKVIVEKEIKVD
jgi:Tripartite tricarboxylate transporter family receptor